MDAALPRRDGFSELTWTAFSKKSDPIRCGCSRVEQRRRGVARSCALVYLRTAASEPAWEKSGLEQYARTSATLLASIIRHSHVPYSIVWSQITTAQGPPVVIYTSGARESVEHPPRPAASWKLLMSFDISEQSDDAHQHATPARRVAYDTVGLECANASICVVCA